MLDQEGRELVASNGTLHAAMTTFTGEDDQQDAKAPLILSAATSPSGVAERNYCSQDYLYCEQRS
jgi:hypothetical protein